MHKYMVVDPGKSIKAHQQASIHWNPSKFTRLTYGEKQPISSCIHTVINIGRYDSLRLGGKFRPVQRRPLIDEQLAKSENDR